MRSNLVFAAAAAWLTASAAWAQTPDAPQVVPPAQRLSLADVLNDASPEIRLIMVGLMIAALASLVLWAMGAIGAGKSGRGGLRSLTFLRCVRAAAPFLGAGAACLTLLGGSLGMANVRPTPSMAVLAPGLAEAFASLALGFLAAGLAALGERHVEGRLRAAAATA